MTTAYDIMKTHVKMGLRLLGATFLWLLLADIFFLILLRTDDCDPGAGYFCNNHSSYAQGLFLLFIVASPLDLMYRTL